MHFAPLSIASRLAAPRELIDDQAPRLYDLLRKVRKSCRYECVRFTEFYLLDNDPLVPPVAVGRGHGFSNIAQREGGVWLNGMEMSGSAAIFPGDSVETKPGFVLIWTRKDRLS